MNATLRAILIGAGIAVGVSTVAGLFASRQVHEARKDASVAARKLELAGQNEKAAWDAAEAAVQQSLMQSARADSAVKVAEHSKVALAAANARFSSLGQAPDTCRKWVGAALAARDEADSTAQHWKAAYDAQVEAAGQLRGAIGTVKAADDSLRPAVDSSVKATEQLVKASKVSFGKILFRALRPKINVNAATLDPQGHFSGPSVGLGWSIGL